MRNLFFTSRFFILLGAIIALFAISFHVSFLYNISQVLLLLLIVTTSSDIYILFSQKNKFSCTRTTPKIFSLGDENKVTLHLKSQYNIPLSVQVIDEIPMQFQIRDFSLSCSLKHGEKKQLSYSLEPKSRGLYLFSHTNIYLSSPLKLIQKREIFDNSISIPVYPSIIQMKKYQLNLFASVKHFSGLKKIQRVGHSYEFDHIKKYSIGEDPRSINWKATSRANELMINHYSDEKSQQVYCILNKSRLMNMPFNGLSLLDYSINTTLTLSNIVLQKFDKIGMMSFSDKMGTIIKAGRNGNQLEKILNALYNESENNLDPNYELLYSAIRYFIPNRSLLFLFTNFESIESLNRNQSLLRKINKIHLLVLIIFENSELDAFIQDSRIERDIDIYNKIIARKLKIEKEQICSELKKHGIQYIFTRPEDLTISTINKFLELKSRGFI